MTREGSPPADEPFLTVIVPVRNEERFLGGVLEELLAQDYPRDRVEILVCDGRSEDRTREIAGEFAARDPRVRLLDNPGIRSSAGRNVGFREGKGEIFLLIDGHVRIGHRELFRRVVEAFRQTGADCLGRPQPLVPVPGHPWSEAIAHARASRLGHSPSSLIFSDHEGFAPAASNGAAWRARVLEIVGLVDESLDACEDLDFNTRIDEAGLRCWTSPRLAVGYYSRTTPAALFRQMARYGLGRALWLRRHPRRLGPAQLAPALLLLALASLPPLAFLAPRLALLPGAVVAVWAVTVLVTSAVLAARTSWRHLPRYPVVFAAIHLGLGWGFLRGVARLLTGEDPPPPPHPGSP